jgi:hypothetical protein
VLSRGWAWQPSDPNIFFRFGLYPVSGQACRICRPVWCSYLHVLPDAESLSFIFEDQPRKSRQIHAILNYFVQYYLGIAKKPDWINRSFVLASWGRTSDEKIKNYRRYVEEGLLSDNSGELSSNEISNIISSNTKRCDEKLLTNKAFQKQLQEIDGLLHENTKAKL